MNFFRTDHLRFSTWEVLFMLACINFYLQCNFVQSAALGRIHSDGKSTGVCRSYCNTSVCLAQSSYFLKFINQTINPCDDFYQFVCGNLIKDGKIPDERNGINIFSEMQYKVSRELFYEISKEIKPNDLDAFKKVKIFYRNCMDETLIKKEDTKPLFKFLNLIGGWPVLLGNDWDESKFDWIESLYILRENLFPLSFPISLIASTNKKNSTMRMLEVRHCNTFVDKSFFSKGLNEKYYKNYYQFMKKIALALGAKKDNVEELKDVLEFDINLFKMQMTAEEALASSTEYLMTVRELSQNYSSIPWLKLFNKFLQPNIIIDENEVVSVTDLKYIAKVEKLLQITSKRILSNYLSLRIVIGLIDYMPVELQRLKTDLHNTLQGTKGSVSRMDKCYTETVEIFPIAASSMYVKTYFNNTEIKKNIYELVQDIQSQTKRTLEELDWMDDKTREAALNKLATMTVNPGYTKELLEDEKINEYYKDMEINPGSYLDSTLNASDFYSHKNYALLREPVNKNDWKSHPSSVIVNAHYRFQVNSIEVPAAILRPPLYQFDRPKYLNYGAIGSVIGHEITHAFDNTGRKYDERGNYLNWWQPETEKRFLNKVKCIIDQYSNFTMKEVGLNVNGILTQGENIADNGGFKAAYHAYNEWVSRNNIYEECLPSLNYSPRQMFWISAANTWCSKLRPEFLEGFIATDEHSPDRARVTVSFSNSKEFAEDFKCDVGTPMNPEKKCVVW